MKFLINSDCLISGQHTAEGTVVTVTDDQAVELMLANRGRVVPEDYAEPAEVPTDEPAEVPTDEPAEVPTDEPAKAAKPTKK
jgi:hypothetical protein